MKRNYLYIKLSLFREKIRRRHAARSAISFFARRGCKLRTPLHVQFNKDNIDLGYNVTIDTGARIDVYPGLGGHSKPKITIGSNTLVMFDFTILCAKRITIGKNCLIASGVFITDENHGTELGAPFIQQKLQTKPIEIGDNVWIGEKAIILPGVHIGNNCVIGAGSVVTRDLPENTVAAGNPAHVIRELKEHE